MEAEIKTRNQRRSVMLGGIQSEKLQGLQVVLNKETGVKNNPKSRSKHSGVAKKAVNNRTHEAGEKQFRDNAGKGVMPNSINYNVNTDDEPVGGCVRIERWLRDSVGSADHDHILNVRQLEQGQFRNMRDDNRHTEHDLFDESIPHTGLVCCR